jgi:hypothetical protein
MSYGIVFWGTYSSAKKVSILQKQIIRIMMITEPKDSCMEIFKKLEIMTSYSQYTYIHIIKNKYVFNFNNEIHKYITRFHNNLLVPPVSTTELKKEPL